MCIRDSDKRIRGPALTTFPQTEGWKIDGETVILDELTIKKITYHFTQRIFKPPTNTEQAWRHRLQVDIPWPKVWQIKSFFATPRDQITWLKLMHRNLYLAPHRDDPSDDTCPLCGLKQNQLHLVHCHPIKEKMWTPLIKLATDMGFEEVHPHNAPSFLAVGRRSPFRAVSKLQSGMLFIAWRCLYAEPVSYTHLTLPTICSV